MFLLNALLHSINEKWEEQGSDEFSYLTTVYIHPSLAKCIEVEGDEVPTSFNPNEFNSIEDGNYFEITIEVAEQDSLIHYEYE